MSLATASIVQGYHTVLSWMVACSRQIKWSFKTSGSWFQRVLALCLIHLLLINHRKRRSKFFLTLYLRIVSKLINILPGVHFPILCSDITIAESAYICFCCDTKRLLHTGWPQKSCTSLKAYSWFLLLIKPTLARVASCIDDVHLFVRLSVCLPLKWKKRDFLKN